MDRAAHSRAGGLLRAWIAPGAEDRWAILLVLLAQLSFFPFFPDMHSANEYSRLYLAYALVDDHDVEITRQIDQFGPVNDKSRVADSYFSDKPPGTAFLVAPFLAVRRALGGDPDPRTDLHLARIVVGVLPTLLLLLLLRIDLSERGVRPATRALCLATYGLGTLGFTYSLLFYGHQLTAVLLYAAYFALRRPRVGPRHAALVGALAALCVAAEYQSAVYLVPVAVLFLLRVRPLGPGLAAGVLGAAPVLAALLGYGNAAFGSPLKTGYNYVANSFFASVHEQGFMGVKYPRATAFVGSLFLPSKGLLFWSPFLILGFLGIPGLRPAPAPDGAPPDRRAVRAERWIRVVQCALPILFVSSMVYWDGGWTVSQRHLTPLVPFLVAPAAGLLDRSRLARLVAPFLAAVSVLFTGLATVVYPHLPEGVPNPLHDLAVPLLRDGCLAATPLEPLVGAGALAVAFVLGVAALAVWFVAAGPDGDGWKLAAVFLLALGPLAAFDGSSRVGRLDAKERGTEIAYFQRQCRVAKRWAPPTASPSPALAPPSKTPLRVPPLPKKSKPPVPREKAAPVADSPSPAGVR